MHSSVLLVVPWQRSSRSLCMCGWPCHPRDTHRTPGQGSAHCPVLCEGSYGGTPGGGLCVWANPELGREEPGGRNAPGRTEYSLSSRPVLAGNLRKAGASTKKSGAPPSPQRRGQVTRPAGQGAIGSTEALYEVQVLLSLLPAQQLLSTM